MDDEAEILRAFDTHAVRAAREAYAITGEVRSSPTLRKLWSMCESDLVGLIKQLCEANLRTEEGLKRAQALQDELTVRRAMLDMLNAVTAEAEQLIDQHELEPEGEYAEDQLTA